MREKLGLLGCLAALGVLLLCSADTARAVREGLALCEPLYYAYPETEEAYDKAYGNG